MAALNGVKTLDMVGGEITKVAYEGAEYERVEGGAKVGDLVTSNYHAESVEFFVCYDVDCDGDVVFADGFPSERSAYELFRKKHVRLKVGDYAKVVEGSDLDEADAGDIVKIIHDDYDQVPFKCDVIKGRRDADYIWAEESDLVLATEAEVAAAKEAEIKRSIEAKWAKSGRKGDEYKAGDIVAYDDPPAIGNLGFGEVTEDTNSYGATRIEAVDYRGDRYRYYLDPEKLTLITPVEARFDRS